MKRVTRALFVSSVCLSLLATARAALAAEENDDDPETSNEESGKAGKSTPAPSGATVTTTNTYVAPWGLPAPGTDINQGLPSSSRPTTDTSRSSDTFDMERSPSGPVTVRGGSNADVVMTKERPPAAVVPRVHTVKRGDTLWALCDHYYHSPYEWPKVWSYNPQIQNPHWIYPGDQLRMQVGPLEAAGGSASGPAMLLRGRGLVPKDTVYLRDYGFIGDPRRDIWGTLIGSREDQSLLAEGNTVYLRIREGVTPTPGQSLTVFTQGRRPEPVKGARKPPGEVVAVRGTVRIDGFDPKSRLARGLVVESLDTIERGASIGPVAREFEVVAPVPSQANVVARILTGLYPHVHFGRDQLLFIDKGSNDGLMAGNRLMVLRKGDAWGKTLDVAGVMTTQRMRTDLPEPARYENTPVIRSDRDFPEEVVGELTVLKTQKYTSLALVTRSGRELVPGDRAVAKKGR